MRWQTAGDITTYSTRTIIGPSTISMKECQVVTRYMTDKHIMLGHYTCITLSTGRHKRAIFTAISY